MLRCHSRHPRAAGIRNHQLVPPTPLPPQNRLPATAITVALVDETNPTSRCTPVRPVDPAREAGQTSIHCVLNDLRGHSPVAPSCAPGARPGRSSPPNARSNPDRIHPKPLCRFRTEALPTQTPLPRPDKTNPPRRCAPVRATCSTACPHTPPDPPAAPQSGTTGCTSPPDPTAPAPPS
jgi:hypothetical protein